MTSDRFRYFRVEGRELLDGLAKGALALELDAAAPAPHLAKMLRQAHTFKGSARIVGLPELGALAHTLEDTLEAHQAGVAIDRAAIDGLLAGVDALDAAFKRLVEAPPTSPSEAAPAASASRPDEAFHTVRVDLAEMDALLESLNESTVHLRALRGDLAKLHLARERVVAIDGPAATRAAVEAAAEAIAHGVRELASRIDRVETELSDSQSRANRLRLVPADVLFGQLERACRDAAMAVGKQVVFEATGGDTRLDGHVLGGLRDALLHGVRNAVDHGIEPVAARLAQGKPAEGRVTLHVERRGARVAFSLRDDGRGVSLARVREVAVARGLIEAGAAAALTPEEALRLVFKPGFTTARALTDLSGRGVGLDVVREIIEGLKGDFTLSSETDCGTTLEAIVPLSLSAMATLLVEAGPHTLGIPLDAVRRTLHVPAAMIVTMAHGLAITYEGDVVPFIALADLLPAGAPRAATGGWSTMILQAGGRLAAVGVDRLIGTADLVVRPLPPAVGDLPLLVGASFDAEGAPQPVLDARGLIAAAHAGIPAAAAGPLTARVLVIDDSVSTRMMLQAILEGAGYAVDQAEDGEAGLAQARERSYALFLVDADMPVLDGFGFLARTRADPALARVPAVMLTSRSSAADRGRALSAGARGYLVKSEFDQAGFLSLLSELVR